MLDAQFLLDLGRKHRPTSVATLRTWCGSFERWRYTAGRGLDDQVLRDFTAHLQDGGKSTVAMETAIWAVRAYFRWLGERGTIVADQAAPSVPRRVYRLGYCPPVDVVDRIVATARASMDPPYGTVFALLPLTGMRVGEMLGLGMADWQVVSGGRVVFSVQHSKTGQPRYVPLRPIGGLLFRSYLLEGRPALLAGRTSPHLFPRPRDPARPVDAKGLEYQLRRGENGSYRAQLDAPELTPHSLRRAFVTWAMRPAPRGGGMTDQQVMKIIGHTNAQTFRIYYRPAPEDVADLVAGEGAING